MAQMVKHLSTMQETWVQFPGLGRFPREGNGSPLQYSCLENPMDRGAQCPWGRKESDTTERLHFHFSFSCIGEGNGYLLQYSWPGESQGWGAWQAAVYGVAQSWTQLKRLSSSSNSRPIEHKHFHFFKHFLMFKLKNFKGILNISLF